jgi:excisionase family DNA binding protein
MNMQEDNRVDFVACQLIRPAEAAKMLSVSRSKCYELIASGVLKSVKLENGRLIRIPLRAIHDLADTAMRGVEVEDHTTR